jgi:hypothetical protein
METQLLQRAAHAGLRNVDAFGRPSDVAFRQKRVERYQQVEVESLYVHYPPLVSTRNCEWNLVVRKKKYGGLGLD